MPLQPKQIVADAKRVGLIRYAAPDADSEERHRQAWQTAIDQHTANVIERTFNAVVKLPDEVGLAPPPKTDRRSRAYRQRPKQPRKWLTKAEAIAKGYSL